MLDHILCKEIFPNIQSKLSLAQLESVSLYIPSLHLTKEADIHLAAASFQVEAESSEIFPWLSLFQNKQFQFLQPLVIYPIF